MGPSYTGTNKGRSMSNPIDPYGQNSPYGKHDPYAGSGGTVGPPYNKNNALVLIIVGALCAGVLPAIFGVLAYLKGDEDPHEARKMQKWGWIAFAIIWAISIILIIVYIVVIAAALNAGAM